ncbi:hypothetical protein B0H11DRAFT_2285853 [Mycena galericulata]|nr:hypothetical protein B0H11DRAFT_2285853 [Mycena galericulata]
MPRHIHPSQRPRRPRRTRMEAHTWAPTKLLAARRYSPASHAPTTAFSLSWAQRVLPDLGGPPFGFPSTGAPSLSPTRSWPTGEPNISTSQTSVLLGSLFPSDYQAGSFPNTARSTRTTEPSAVASPTRAGACRSTASPPLINLPASYRGAIPTLDPPTPPRTPSRAKVPSRALTPFNTPNTAPSPPMDAQYTPAARRSHPPVASDSSLFGESMSLSMQQRAIYSTKRKLDETEDDRPRKRAGKEVEPAGSQGAHV